MIKISFLLQLCKYSHSFLIVAVLLTLTAAVHAQIAPLTPDIPSKYQALTVVHRLTYRPFDNRWIYYNRAIIEKGDSKYPSLRRMLRSNLALLTARIQATGTFDAVFLSKFLVEMKTAKSSRSCTVFPLYLTENGDSQQATLDI
jgi:predicted helicase